MTYTFGLYHLDAGRRLLSKNGEPVALPAKVFETLLILVEAEGALVPRAELMKRLWPDTFVEDGTLARNISDLRKLLDEPGQDFIATFPKVGYRLVPAVNKVAPPVLTPAALPRKSYRRYGIGVAAAIVLAIGLAYALTKPEPAVRTLAVLPFLSLDTAPDRVLLGQELADSIITRLGTFDVVVRPPSSVLSMTAKDRDPLEAGRKLRVDAILDGTIQKVGSDSRLTMRLLRVKDGRAIWSATFDRQASNLFDLESTVARQLEPVLTGRATPSTAPEKAVNQESRHAYYQARYWLERRNLDGIRKSLGLYQASAAADPGFAPAYSGQAEAYLFLTGYGFTSQDELIGKARAAANHALELDPNLAETHRVLALIAENYDLDWSRADEEYRKAVELAPQYAGAHHFYGEFLVFIGRAAEGRRHLELARQLDPTSLIVATDYAHTYVEENQIPRAIQLTRQVLDLDPKFARARYYLALELAVNGECAEARIQARQYAAEQSGATALFVNGILEARCGDRKAALKTIAEVQRQKSPWSMISAGLVYAMLGDGDPAIDCLHRAIDNREIGLVNLKVNPLLARIRNHPRFPELIQRLKYPGTSALIALQPHTRS